MESASQFGCMVLLLPQHPVYAGTQAQIDHCNAAGPRRLGILRRSGTPKTNTNKKRKSYLPRVRGNYSPWIRKTSPWRTHGAMEPNDRWAPTGPVKSRSTHNPGLNEISRALGALELKQAQQSSGNHQLSQGPPKPNLRYTSAQQQRNQREGNQSGTMKPWLSGNQDGPPTWVKIRTIPEWSMGGVAEDSMARTRAEA